MRPHILAHSTGPDMLRAYIESNLAFRKEHRNHMLAIVEIARYGEAGSLGTVSPLEAAGTKTAGGAGTGPPTTMTSTARHRCTPLENANEGCERA